MRHRAEDLLDPNDTSGGIRTYIPDKNGFGMNRYSLQMHIPYVDLSTEEKDPTFSSQKDMDKHTTSRRNLRDTYSFSHQLILHFKPNYAHIN